MTASWSGLYVRPTEYKVVARPFAPSMAGSPRLVSRFYPIMPRADCQMPRTRHSMPKRKRECHRRNLLDRKRPHTSSYPHCAIGRPTGDAPGPERKQARQDARTSAHVQVAPHRKACCRPRRRDADEGDRGGSDLAVRCLRTGLLHLANLGERPRGRSVGNGNGGNLCRPAHDPFLWDMHADGRPPSLGAFNGDPAAIQLDQTLGE
jgi:hypothetical protein